MDWMAVAQSISTYAPLLSGVLAATGVGAAAASKRPRRSRSLNQNSHRKTHPRHYHVGCMR